MIKIAFTLIIVIYFLTIAFMKQQTTNAIAKTRVEERLVCENTINEANTKSTQTTIKTIKRYEIIKSNLSKTDLNQRTRLLQQLEDFNFAD